jgi:hypothetical protein
MTKSIRLERIIKVSSLWLSFNWLFLVLFYGHTSIRPRYCIPHRKVTPLPFMLHTSIRLVKCIIYHLLDVKSYLLWPALTEARASNPIARADSRFFTTVSFR